MKHVRPCHVLGSGISISVDYTCGERCGLARTLSKRWNAAEAHAVSQQPKALEAPDSSFTEADVNAAVSRAIAFLQKAREPHALLFIGILNRRFGIEQFANPRALYDEVLPEHPERAPVLRVFRRIFDADNPMLPDDWDHVTSPLDRLLVSALYCDRLGLPPSSPKYSAEP